MFESVRAKINTTGANLRKGPGKDFGLVDQVALGDIVQVFSSWVNPVWVKVRVLKTRTGIAVGKEGYIWSTELSILPPEIEPVVPVPLPAPTPDHPPPLMPSPMPPVSPPTREEGDITRNLIRGALIVVAVVVAALAIMWLTR